MAAVSSSREQQQRFAALSIAAGGGGAGGGERGVSEGSAGMMKASSSTLPASPLARRGVGLSSSSVNGHHPFDKEPLLPTTTHGGGRDASSGDLHGHWKRASIFEQQQQGKGANVGVVNSLGMSRSFVAGSAYCMASTSMVLLNKAALSSFGFGAPTALLLFQCTICSLAAAAVGFSGLSRLERPSWKLLKSWAPVNVLFVGMVWSSVFALRDLGVPMVTVLKNLTNLFTICGDFFLFGRVYGRRVWMTLALMALSALCGAATDLEFSAAGYSWQIANCAFTSAYSLALRLMMEKGGDALWGLVKGGGGSGGSASENAAAAAAAALAVGGGGGEKAAAAFSSSSSHLAPRQASQLISTSPHPRRLNELSMVFYNNALSLPLIAVLAWARGDLGRASTEPALGDPRFLAAAGASAALAFGISFTSLWFLSTTTATTFSLVGSLNKVPVAAVGLVAFGVPATAQNVAAICVGLAASAVFVWAKQGDAGSSSSKNGGGGVGGGIESGSGGGSGTMGSGNGTADADSLLPPGSGSKALRR